MQRLYAGSEVVRVPVNLEELKAMWRRWQRGIDTDELDVLVDSTLPALIAEVEASRAEIETERDLFLRAEARVVALRAEIEALRKALLQVAKFSEHPDYSFCRICGHDWRFPHRSDCPVAALASPADATHEQVIGGREG